MPASGAVDIKKEAGQIKGRITFQVKQDEEELVLTGQQGVFSATSLGSFAVSFLLSLALGYSSIKARE